MLGVPLVKFKCAESIAILPTCSIEVFDILPEINCKRLFIEYIDVETPGIKADAPRLKFSKIRANFNKCRMMGGFEGIFRIIANSNL